jgi:uncharacterized protein
MAPGYAMLRAVSRWNGRTGEICVAVLDQPIRGPGIGRRLAAVGATLCLLLTAAAANAALIELLVEADGEEEAIASGLEEALVRVAGFQSPALAGLVPRLLEDPAQPWLRSRAGRGEGRFLLTFDRAELRAVLRESQVPVWVGSRPALLVWAVLERGERRLLLGLGLDEDAVLATLREWAGRRDLPLLFPLGDLEDRRQVYLADVVGGMTEGLAEASRRYDPDGLLLLHLVQRDDRVHARSWLSYRGHVLQAGTSASTAAEAGREAVADAIDALGLRQARAVGDEAASLFGFIGIRGMADLQSLRSRIAALEAVQAVQLSRLLPDAAVLELRSGLDARGLVEVLAGEGFRITDPPGDFAEDVTLWLQVPRSAR